MTITDIDTYRSGLRLIIRFLRGQENYFLLVTIFFSSPQNNLIAGIFFRNHILHYIMIFQIFRQRY